MSRTHSLVSVFVGLGIGFAAMYPWMKQRAPAIVQSRPVRFIPESAPGRPVPPLDPQRVKQLEKAFQDDPKNPEPAAEIANIYWDHREFQKAADWYEKALDVKDDSELRIDYGITLFTLKQYDGAIAQFRRILEGNANHPRALALLGFALLEGKNDAQGAILSWEKFLQTNPDFPGADEVRQKLDALKREQKQ